MLREKYLSVLRKIMDLHERKGAWEACVAYAEKYLAIDPYAEPLYRALMRFFACLSQMSRVIESFKRCEAFIQDDLGCPLSEGTLALYQTLTGKTAGSPERATSCRTD